MTICLVTDRRRLGRAMRASVDTWTDLLVSQIRAATESGVDLIQLRETDLDAAELLRLTTRILHEVPESRDRLLVNERLDVALAAGAAGVHLRELSFSVEVARRVAPAGLCIGRSVHDPAGAAAAGEADYLIAGTVLSTPSKTVSRFLGWEGLASVVNAAGRRPVLGIGGLSAVSVSELSATGASGLAAIGAFIPDSNQGLAAFVQATIESMRFAFDSSDGVS
jgi:thiamine-phosphate pyrophosphorylase